jgi:hypothetical protein
MKTHGNKVQQISVAMITLPCLLGTLLAGCSSMRSGANDVKAAVVEPAPDAGFIENPSIQAKRYDLPFQKVWIKKGFDMNAYRTMVVPPVNTDYMMEMDWLHKAGSANWVSNVKKDIANLAVYFHDEIVKQFTEDPKKRFQIIENQEPVQQGTLSLELALIEINPSQPLLHAAGWLVPGGGTAAGIVNKRTAAFEGRLRDLQTGEVVATFADRDMQDAGPIDLTRLTWYGPAKGIMDQWAKQFVQIANRQPGESVTDPVPFTLRPF